MSKNDMERAYNSRSTRPIWHWWKPWTPKHGTSLVSDVQNRVALCGANAWDDNLDGNVGHLRGCGRCDSKHRELTAK